MELYWNVDAQVVHLPIMLDKGGKGVKDLGEVESRDLRGMLTRYSEPAAIK